MRKKTALVVLLAALCYILGSVTAVYFPIPTHLGAGLTRLLQGRVRPFMVSRNFNETIGYVTDRKAGPLTDGNVTYLSEYAGQPSYGLINVQVPQYHPFSSPIDGGAIKKVESIPYSAFLQFLQGQSGKPLVIWIHGYRASFPLSTVHCAQVARALNIDANVLTFDWASNESVLGYTRDVLQIPHSTKHLVDLLEAINNEVKPPKIIIIAHSLGCRLVCLDSNSYTPIRKAENLKLDHVIFIAPNVDREEFDQNFKSELEALVNRLTIYVASDDNVLFGQTPIQRRFNRSPGTVFSRHKSGRDPDVPLLRETASRGD